MVYFASDIHLGSGGEVAARETERRFVAWLDRIAADAEAIVLAGDVFDFWFEFRGVVPKGFVRTLGRLAELADRGVRILFFTGNHDLWVGDYFRRECGMEVYTRPQVLELGGRRIFVAHGDNMGFERDFRLRCMNRIFRSRMARRIFVGLVPASGIMRFGRRWSAHSRRRQGAVKGTEQVVEPLIAYARAYAEREPVDHFVFGHMHFAHEHRDGALHTVHLGDWGHGTSWAELDADGALTLQKLER